MEMDSPSTNAGSILTLNNDCLLEVFKYLDLQEICAVADVCRCFRQNAKVCFKYSKKTCLSVTKYIESNDDSLLQFTLKVSKIIRLFGAFLNEFVDLIYKKRWEYGRLRAKCRRRILKQLAQYCSGTLNHLAIFSSEVDIDDEMVLMLRPLLERLQKLSLIDCTITETFLHILPFWAPELRELDLYLNEKQLNLHYDYLHQPFEKLVKISLAYFPGLSNNDLEQILKHNPQLRTISLRTCRSLDHRIFQTIVAHTPDIVDLYCGGIILEREDAKYFGQMKNLKSLSLAFENGVGLMHVLPAIHQIAAANIQLKELRLLNVHCGGYADELVEVISQFQELEILTIREVSGLTLRHLHDICKYCTELRVLRVLTRIIPPIPFITTMLRDAKKLELLCILKTDTVPLVKNLVDIGTYKEWVKIAKRRGDKNRLKLILEENSYTTSLMPTPITARNGQFALKIGLHEYWN